MFLCWEDIREDEESKITCDLGLRDPYQHFGKTF